MGPTPFRIEHKHHDKIQLASALSILRTDMHFGEPSPFSASVVIISPIVPLSSSTVRERDKRIYWAPFASSTSNAFSCHFLRVFGCSRLRPNGRPTGLDPRRLRGISDNCFLRGSADLPPPRPPAHKVCQKEKKKGGAKGSKNQ